MPHPQLALGLLFVALALAVVAAESTRWGRRRPGAVLGLQAVVVAAFAGATWAWLGRAAAGGFLAGWVTEQALSVDNLFVFMLIFERLGIEPAARARCLRYGLIGAALARGLMVGLGLVLMARLSWATRAFGLLLVASAGHVVWGQLRRRAAARPAPGAQDEAPAALGWVARRLRLATDAPAEAFFVPGPGGWQPTRLLAALLACELADVVFAFDSVPAVLSVTREPVLALAANLLAVVSLRSLFAWVAGRLRQLRFLEPALGLMLLLIGLKMALHEELKIGAAAQVGGVVLLLAAAVAASAWWPQSRGSSGGSSR